MPENLYIKLRYLKAIYPEARHDSLLFEKLMAERKNIKEEQPTKQLNTFLKEEAGLHSSDLYTDDTKLCSYI